MVVQISQAGIDFIENTVVNAQANVTNLTAQIATLTDQLNAANELLDDALVVQADVELED